MRLFYTLLFVGLVFACMCSTQTQAEVRAVDGRAEIGKALLDQADVPTIGSIASITALLWDNTAILDTANAIVANDLRGRHPDSSLVQTADDFVIPAGQQWSIDSVYTEGLSNQVVLPDSFAVVIYADTAGSPGAQVYKSVLIPSNGLSLTVQRMRLATPAVLGPGRYWLSVYAVFNTGTNLAVTRWNWKSGAPNFGIQMEARLRDFTGLFGIPPFPWTPLSGLGVNRPSVKFALFGQVQSPTQILLANPGPANNGGSSGWAMFLNLIAGPRSVTVTHMTTASTAAASASYSVEILTRTGNALGGPVGSGPGSSPAGWTSIGTAPVVQGPVGSGVSLLFAIPNISINPNDTVGVAIRFTGAGPRYVGTGSPPYSIYADSNLTLVTGDGRSAPFTTTGSWFASRALVGEIHYNATTVDVTEPGEIPSAFVLLQNYPNPFNPSTTIGFSLPSAGTLSLKIFNILGQEIATIADGQYQAGTYNVQWNASGHASGVYFYKLQAGNFSQIKKLMLMK